MGNQNQGRSRRTGAGRAGPGSPDRKRPKTYYLSRWTANSSRKRRGACTNGKSKSRKKPTNGRGTCWPRFSRSEEAKDILLEQVDSELKQEKTRRLHEWEIKIKEEADERARDVLAQVIPIGRGQRHIT